MLNVTDIRVRVLNTEGRLKAVATITIDDSFVVHDIKVIEGDENLFIAMPSKKTPSDNYRDIAHPIDTETRRHLEEMILAKYQEELAKQEKPEE